VNFQRGRAREEPEINLVPMIDVMLVILIFLMITTTYSKYTELQINLPTADTEKQLERPGEVSVLVNAKGQYVVNRAPVVVIISADASATHQSVVRIMEASRLAGLSQITFTTQSTK
jgi:biopolymer transport protein ExbD